MGIMLVAVIPVDWLTNKTVSRQYLQTKYPQLEQRSISSNVIFPAAQHFQCRCDCLGDIAAQTSCDTENIMYCDW